MACTCLAQEVALLEVQPCWSRCIAVGVGFGPQSEFQDSQGYTGKPCLKTKQNKTKQNKTKQNKTKQTLALASWKPFFSYMPLDGDVELSAPPGPHLPGRCHSPTLMKMDLTSEPVSQAQLNVVLIRVALAMVSVHSSKPLRQCLCGLCGDF